MMAFPSINDENVTEKDCTSYIVNPSFEQSTDGWTNSSLQSQGNSDFPYKHASKYMEKWVAPGNAVGSASIKQTVTNLPVGRYRLTVGAQNLDQNNKSAQKTGAYIMAGTAKTTVYTPGDYSVEFENVSGSVQIGFVASSAQGNWIAVDNFRLYYIGGDIDVAAAKTALTTIHTKAKSLLSKQMNAQTKAELQACIDAAKAVIDGNADYTAEVTDNLNQAIAAANTSISAFTSLTTAVNTANTLVGSFMGDEYAEALAKALADGQAVLNSEVEYTDAIKTALDNANDAAKASVDAYKALNTSVANAEKVYGEEKVGAADLLAAIEKAKTTAQDKTVKTADVENETAALESVLFVFNVSNATAGTGTAPKVTVTHKYVATGATQALVRATMTGSNIIERGVCWSTHRNPTVLDNRTTKSYSLNGYIFHIEGLTPSTVYYVRAYAMNKTYTVAYGEERKVVTHPMGNCTWSWNEGAPTAEANTRCRNAVKETIDYFNEWTGIRGFKLTGNYGSGTPTADCSYGGWMNIGPNASYQAIGTVLHETGHGVGVGTRKIAYGYSTGCWDDTNVHDWKWYGREANDIYGFLENKEAKPYTSDFCMVGDGTHGWGQSASYDWFVNGADKDKHTAFQYIGGCCLLYGLFIDGLCPTDAYPNGLSGYTYNFDSDKKYYIMNKSIGLGTAVLSQGTTSTVGLKECLTPDVLNDSCAWTIDYDPVKCYYTFKNVASGRYLTHASGSANVTSKTIATKPSTTEYSQLMPDRKDVTFGTGVNKITTHGYWFTWNSGGNKAMSANSISKITGIGKATQVSFNYAETPSQQWIIISEDEIEKYHNYAVYVGVESISVDDSAFGGEAKVAGIYTSDGIKLQKTQPGLNIIRYTDGSTKKIFVK